MAAESEPLAGPEHLNNYGCVIKLSPGKGRGVYASRFIPRNTIIEISPVLLFTKDEYEEHGKFTILDHYTFNWTDGRMALALGLGSLFNHSECPNVSFSLDTKSDSIRYTTTRNVLPGEELCIFYGFKLWFSPAEKTETPGRSVSPVDDGWGGLTAVEDDGNGELTNPYDGGDSEEIVPEDQLPFIRFKLPPEEEEPDSVRTVNAWVVDVPEARLITTLLKWLKQAGLEGPELGHLKRIRKQGDKISLLLSTALEPPELPQDLNLPPPYTLAVPASSALTLPSLSLKSALWPTMYTPRRKDEPEPWTRGKLRWAWNAMKKAVDTAVMGQSESQELSIAAYIPAPFGDSGDKTSLSADCALTFAAWDTRKSTRHPLRHAAINAVRKLADYRAFQDSEKPTAELGPSDTVRNGSNYLLTDQSIFITNEPCIMCSMALLHSRVKDVFVLYPMPRTGGCGGCTCLPTLKGVNHRFGILQWKDPSQFSDNGLAVDSSVDA